MNRERLSRLVPIAFAAGAAAAAWLGCSEVLGIRGLTSPVDGGAMGDAADASRVGDAEPGSDGDADATAGDAIATDARPSDASPGDAPGVEASSVDWCRLHAPDAMACQDFDDLDAFPPPGWNVVSFGTAGDGGLDDGVFRSPPMAVTLDVPALTSGQTSQWWLLRSGLPTPAGTSTVTLAFDVRVDQGPSGSGSYVVLGGVVFGLGSGNSASVELLSDANGLHLVQGFGASLTDFGISTSPLPAPGIWTRLELDLTIDADDGGAWASASVSGQAVTFDAGAIVTLTTLAGYGAPSAGVGNLITLGPTPVQVVHIDDIVVDVQR